MYIFVYIIFIHIIRSIYSFNFTGLSGYSTGHVLKSNLCFYSRVTWFIHLYTCPTHFLKQS